MEYRRLGQSDLEVSALCLGSMTWGAQNDEAEAHAQIDAALAGGINFIDTAELYPTYPVRAETVGRTEEIIGNWLARSGRRGDVVIATKVTGAGQKAVREGAPVSAETIRTAVEGSLKRLRCEVIDLYQLHWPNRGSYHFRQNWAYDPSGQDRAQTEAHMLDVLQEMQRQIEAGRVRWFGLSNESAWGTAKWLELARRHGLPRVQTIQNEYSLLCRLFDTDLAELAHNEQVSLLAYTPLAAGLLSGKYAPDVTPAGSRRSISGNLNGRITPRVWGAIDAYGALARRHGLELPQMALAWAMARPFMGSVIFGATRVAHVETALAAAELKLDRELLDDIAAVHRAHPMPF